MSFQSKIFVRVRQTLKKFGKLTPIAAVTAFLPMLGTSVLLVAGYPIGMWLRDNQEVGAASYVLGIVIFCGLALVPTNVIGVIGGWAFGFDVGLALLMVAIVGASLISFLIHRRIVGNKVPDLAEKHPKAKAIYEALIGEGFWRTMTIVLLIRLSILMPFALTNFIFASAKVRIGTFLAGTFLGMLPRSGAVVFAGAGLSELSLEGGSQTWIIISGILATLSCIVIISILSRRALERITTHPSD